MDAINPSIKHKEISGVSLVTNLTKLLPIAIQLGLIIGFTYLFQIEADLGLPYLMMGVGGAFIVNALAPIRIRPIIFFAAFIGMLTFFVGEWGMIKIVVLGISLLGICHLPIPILFRKIILSAIGVTFAAMMLGYIPTIFVGYHLRVLTILLMFRIILYLHELPHEKESVSIWQRLNYFFLLPNIIIPLFPIVDYQKFKKSYYNDDDVLIYQKGINLITWSLLCILMYRFIYHFLAPNLFRLDGVQEVMTYIVTSYLSVIRLVGLLSLSVGIIRLFGYKLPDIFNYMFFASSFSDLFRRINIYWKDFLMKICYYPTYFRVRKITPKYALTLATMVTFLFTWFFHVYQWFWVLGTNPISETGMIYWGIFGLVATLNTLTENKKKKQKSKATMGFAFTHTSKVFGTFLAMATLYSVWMAPTFAIWMSMIVTALRDSLNNWMITIGVILTLYLLASMVYFIFLKNKTSLTSIWNNFQSKNIVKNGAVLSLMIALSFGTNSNENLKLFVKNDEFNANDINAEYSGYYDEILALNNDVGSRIWGRDYSNKKDRLEEKLEETDFVREVDNVLGYEFVPNSKSTYKKKEITINSWGFRDKEYAKIPPPNTIRIALLGASPVMGSGVADKETFDYLLENQINEKYGSDSLQIEILNFARSSLGPFHFAYQMENQIRHFQPDYVMMVSHCRQFGGFTRKLKRIWDADKNIYPELQQFISEKNIKPSNIKTETQKEKQGEKIADFSFKILKETCDKYNFPLIWTFLPPPNKEHYYPAYKAIADKNGYKNHISLEGVYDNYNANLVQVSVIDRHPNDWGHKIIAEKLLEELEVFLNLKPDQK